MRAASFKIVEDLREVPQPLSVPTLCLGGHGRRAAQGARTMVFCQTRFWPVISHVSHSRNDHDGRRHSACGFRLLHGLTEDGPVRQHVQHARIIAPSTDGCSCLRALVRVRRPSSAAASSSCSRGRKGELRCIGFVFDIFGAQS